MARPLHIPDAPRIAGLGFRMFEPEHDYPAMLDVLNQVGDADSLGERLTMPMLMRMDSGARDFDPSKGRFVAEIDGQMIGVATCHRSRHSDGSMLYYHIVDLIPRWRRQGIGRAVLRQCQSMLRQLASFSPEPEDSYFSTYAIAETQVGALALLTQDGYVPARHMYKMVRPNLSNISDAPLAPGIEIRSLEPQNFRQVWESIQEAVRGAWGFVEPTAGAFDAWARNEMLRPGLSRIAWAGDKVVGTVLIFVHESDNQLRNRKRAWTETITVGKPWRRIGIAKALIASALRSIRDVDMQEAALNVDTQNVSGALTLYENMGYQIERRVSTLRKRLSLSEAVT